jgi:hypothetical protein
MFSRARTFAVGIGVAVLAVAGGSTALANGGDGGRGHDETLRVQLSGYEEDPLALSTTGSAHFRATIDEDAGTIKYRLSYRDLEGAVTQAHIHFGGRAQSGGISVFLCTNQGNGPEGTQTCPAAPATITGTIVAANVGGPAGQGIAAGEFAEFVEAIRAGKTYANVHSAKYPAGEVRGQLDHHH